VVSIPVIVSNASRRVRYRCSASGLGHSTLASRFRPTGCGRHHGEFIVLGERSGHLVQVSRGDGQPQQRTGGDAQPQVVQLDVEEHLAAAAQLTQPTGRRGR